MAIACSMLRVRGHSGRWLLRRLWRVFLLCGLDGTGSLNGCPEHCRPGCDWQCTSHGGFPSSCLASGAAAPSGRQLTRNWGARPPQAVVLLQPFGRHRPQPLLQIPCPRRRRTSPLHLEPTGFSSAFRFFSPAIACKPDRSSKFNDMHKHHG